MSEVPRLSESGDAFDARLLRAARGEKPGDSGRRKTIAAVALIGAATAVSSTTVRSALTSAGKWLGACVLLAGGGTLAYLSGAHTPQKEMNGASSVAMVPCVSSSPAASPAPTIEMPRPKLPEPLPKATENAVPVVRQARRAKTASSPIAPLVAEASLPSREELVPPSEIQLLARAKLALRDHAPDVALSVLARYRAAYPHAALAEESEVVGIEALSLAGRKTEAASAAWLFEEKYPKSPYTVRVKALLTDAMRDAQ